jgi:hypothetical protein
MLLSNVNVNNNITYSRRREERDVYSAHEREKERMEDTREMVFWWHTRERGGRQEIKKGVVSCFSSCGTLDYLIEQPFFSLSMVKQPRKVNPAS